MSKETGHTLKQFVQESIMFIIIYKPMAGLQQLQSVFF